MFDALAHRWSDAVDPLDAEDEVMALAREHKVPVLEAPPLARALYTHGEVDREIPARLFSAVAQVLGYEHVPAERLLADVSEFMTLGEGDVLMLGCDVNRPRAKAGDRIEIAMPALGSLSNTLVAEAA